MCEALDAGKPEEQCFQVWSRESCPCLSTPYKNSHGYPAQIHALVHANHHLIHFWSLGSIFIVLLGFTPMTPRRQGPAQIHALVHANHHLIHFWSLGSIFIVLLGFTPMTPRRQGRQGSLEEINFEVGVLWPCCWR